MTLGSFFSFYPTCPGGIAAHTQQIVCAQMTANSTVPAVISRTWGTRAKVLIWPKSGMWSTVLVGHRFNNVIGLSSVAQFKSHFKKLEGKNCNTYRIGNTEPRNATTGNVCLSSPRDQRSPLMDAPGACNLKRLYTDRFTFIVITTCSMASISKMGQSSCTFH